MTEWEVPAVKPLDEAAMTRCQLRLDNLTKPLGSLHSFEHLARQMAGITGVSRPCSAEALLVIVEGYRPRSRLCEPYAKHVAARIVDFALHPEGTVRTVRAAVPAEVYGRGVRSGRDAASRGGKMIGLGLSGLLPAETAAAVMRWHLSGSVDLAASPAAGCPEIAALAGLILGAAAGGAAVVLDGTATALAALVAVRQDPAVRDYLVGSHREPDPDHEEALKLLRLPVYLDLGLKAPEGIGAALGISLLRAALHVLGDMKTFGEAGVHVAEDGPGALVQTRDVRDTEGIVAGCPTYKGNGRDDEEDNGYDIS